VEKLLRKHTWLKAVLGLTLVWAALPDSAMAQGWLSDRSRAEGPGIRVGDFELHPGLGVEVGYDTNLYYSDGESDRTAAVDSGILRATAHLLFATRGAERRQEGESGGGEGERAPQPSVTFRGGLSGSFYAFFNDLDRSNMEVDASLALSILPGRAFSVDLTEEFGRSVRPFTESFDDTLSYARIQNDAGLRVNLATTGQVFRVSAGYNFRLDFFESAALDFGNRFQHVVSLQETFRFLPQTGIFHDTQVSFLDYVNPGGPVLTNDGVLVRSRVGINGAITSNFSVLAAAGYGAGFYDSTSGTYDQEYESVVAQIQARWQISEETRLTFGYDRDFQPSFVGNFYRFDRGSAQFQTIISGVFLVGVEASFGYYEFGAIVQPDGMTPVGSSLGRGDFRLIGSVFGEYRFTDWLGVNATLNYIGNFTDYSYQIDPGMAPVFLDPAGFNKFQAWLGVRVFY